MSLFEGSERGDSAAQTAGVVFGNIIFMVLKGFLLGVGIVAAFWVFGFATPAKADDSWPYSEFSKPKPRIIKVHRKPRVRGYVRRKRRKAKPVTRLNGFTCKQEFAVTGEVKSNEERAKKSAWSAFHGAVKFALGERFADERFAKNPRFECARSTSETLTSKTVEAVTGGGGVYRHRCKLRARACKPPESD